LVSRNDTKYAGTRIFLAPADDSFRGRGVARLHPDAVSMAARAARLQDRGFRASILVSAPIPNAAATGNSFPAVTSQFDQAERIFGRMGGPVQMVIRMRTKFVMARAQKKDRSNVG
jgi:hypothetical protein